MMYYAVASGGLDGGAQITASHNPKQYNGCKLVKAEAFPLSGESGIREMKEMMLGGTLPPPAAQRGTVDPRRHHGPLHRARDGVHRPGGDPALQRRPRRRQRHRRRGRPAPVRPPALPDDPAVLRGRRHLPQPRGQPAHRGEPPGHRRRGRAPEGRHRHRLGRRRRPLLLHRRLRRVHRRRLHHGAARRGVPDAPARRDDHLRRAGQLRGEGRGRRATAGRR